MFLRIMAVAAVVLGMALPAAAGTIDSDAQYNAGIKAYAKKSNYIRFKSNNDWTWSAANFGNVKGLKVVNGDYEGGPVWAVEYTAKGQGHAVIITEPSFIDFKAVDAIYLRKDLKELVVYGKQGTAMQPYVFRYKYQFSPSALDDLELFVGQE